MDLRPPLPPKHCPRMPPIVPSSDNTKKQQQNEINTRNNSRPAYHLLLRDLLCRMYIAAESMCLGTEARFTGLVLFHRYAAHYFADRLSERKELHGNNGNDGGNEGFSSHRNHLGVVAAACLFLGCKIEEEPRRIRDAINLCHILDFEGCRDEKNSSNSSSKKRKRLSTSAAQEHNEKGGNKRQQQYDNGNDDSTSNNSVVHVYEAQDPPELDESYWDAKERLVATEQNVLRVLQFDASVSHPHRAVVSVFDVLGFWSYVNRGETENDNNDGNNGDGSTESKDEKNHDEFVQKEKKNTNNNADILLKGSWRILNDSVFHAPALQQPVLTLACAALCLSAEQMMMKEKKKSMPSGRNSNSSHSVGQQTCHASYGVDATILPPCWWKALGIDDLALEDAKKSLMDASNSLVIPTNNE